MSQWVQYTKANRFNDSYIKGFLDVSGGDLLLRHGDASMNQKLYVEGDASFNSNVDICGNFYAQYPDNSIPSSAVIGGVGSGFDNNSDLSLNANLSVSGDTSFNNVYVGGNVQIQGDFLPTTANSSDIGSAEKPFGSLYVSNNTIFFVGDNDENTGTLSLTDGTLGFKKRNEATATPFIRTTNNGRIGVGQGKTSENAEVELDVSGNMVVSNHAQISSLTLSGDASFNRHVYVDGVTTMNSTLVVDGDASLNHALSISGDASLNSDVYIGGNNVVEGDLTIKGNLAVYQTTETMTINTTVNQYELIITEDLSLNGKLSVSSDTSFNRRVDICGNFYAQYPTNSIPTDAIDGIVGLDTESDISLNAALSVGGSSVLGSTLAVSQGASFASALDVSGATVLDSTLVIQGEASLNNALSVDGVTTLNSTLFVDGDVSFNQSVYVNSGLTISGDILPNVGNTYSLGSAEKPFAGLYISNNTIHFAGSGSDSGALSFESGGLKIQGTDEEVQELLSVSNNKVAIGKASVLANGNLDVSGTIVASGDVSLNNNLLVGGDLSLNGDLTIQGNLAVFQRTNTMTINTTVNDYEVIVTNDLSLNGDLLIDGDLSLNGDAYVNGDVSFNGTMSVADATTLNSTLVVDGDASFNAELYVNQATNLNSTLDVVQATTMQGTLSVADATTLSSTLLTTGDASFNAGLYVNQATNLNSTLDVAQATNLNSTLDVSQATNLNSTLSVADATTLSSTLLTTGDASFNAGLYVNQATNLNSTLNVAQATNLNSTLSVADATTLSSTLLTTGDASFNAGLYVNRATNLNSTLNVAQATNLNSTLNVANATTLSSTLIVDGDASFNAGLYVVQATNLNSTLDVVQATNLNSTLSVADATTLSSTLVVEEDVSFNAGLSVEGDVSFNADLIVDGDVVIKGTLGVFQSTSTMTINTTVNTYEVIITNDLSLNGTLSMSGNADISGTLITIGDASFNSALSVNGDVSFNSGVYMNGATTMQDTLNVANATTLNSTLLTTGDASFNAGLYVNQATNLNSTLAVTHGASFASVLDVSGATVLDSTLVVDGDVSFNNHLFVGGDLSLNGGLSTEGSIQASYNTDTTHVFGKAQIGYVGHNGLFGVSHVSQGTSGYALLQNDDGLTYLNAASGQQVKFRINNIDKMIIDNNGRIGIGTTTPTHGLSCSTERAQPQGHAYGVHMGTANNLDYSQISLMAKNACEIDFGINSTRGRISYVVDTNNMNFATNGVTTDMTIDSVGNVGIGTTSPTALLQVNGSTILDSTLVVDGDVSMNNKLSVGADASFNGRVDICGNFYAQYPTNSIPSAAIDGTVGLDTESDISLNAALSVGQATTLNSTLVVQGDASFNGRVDICGNFYAQYPTNSIPSDAIIGDIGSGSGNTIEYVPLGGIIIWNNAASIPDGFSICDGSTVNGITTPNLTGKFVIGRDPNNSYLSSVDNSGGSFLVEDADLDDYHERQFDSTNDSTYLLGGVPVTNTTYTTPYYVLVYIQRTSNVISDIEGSADASLNAALSVGQATTLNSTLVVQGDASFNGRVDICGNFYAQYPTNSIPSAAIDGTVGLDTESDISLNAALSVGQATTLNSTLVVQGDATLSGNNTFAGTNTFTNSLPECSITPTSNNQLVNKSYVDSVSSSGGDVTLSGNNTFTGNNNFNNNVGFQTTTPHSQVQINTPMRYDGGTNSIGKLVVAGPITTASNDFTNSTAILRVVGNNATNSLQMGVGNGTYSYEPWIQGSYDNSNTSNNDHGPKRIRMNPLGQNIVIHGTSGYSDDRVKINEQYITNATDTLMKLKPQTYTRYAIMDASGNIDYESWNTFESGLITQEVYYDAPELRHLVDIPDDADLSGNAIQTSEDPSVDPDYSTWGTSIASLNYTGIIPYLIKSNQEQQELINAEKEKTAALESKVTLLETKNATLHTQLVYLIARVTALENSST